MLADVKGRLKVIKAVTEASVCCGWTRDEVCLYLYSLLILHRPDVVIQTGHLWGKSSVFILDALSTYNDRLFDDTDVTSDHTFDAFVVNNAPVQKQHGTLYSIDPDPWGVMKWEDGIKLLNTWYGDNFKFINESSHVVLPTLKDVCIGKRVFGMVDGDHTAVGCRQDIKDMIELGAQWIFVDDTAWLPDLYPVVEEFATDYRVNYIPLYNGVSVLMKCGVNHG